MTIAIKPTASGSTIEQDGSTILTVDGSGNITPSNQLYPKVPAFSAYLSSNQSISTATHTKVQFDTEEFDTTDDYDNATNYRYTPSVAGYYHVTGVIRADASTTLNRVISNVFKNGTQVKRGTDISGGNGLDSVISTIVYCNGSTDYLELYGYISATTAVVGTAGSNLVYFQAHLVSV